MKEKDHRMKKALDQSAMIDARAIADK